MINKFEKQLERWNNGTLRGAQAKLAKCLHVSTATVALWATGKRHPSKGYLSQLGHLFGMDAYDVARLFLPSHAVSIPLPPSKGIGLHDSRDFAITYSTDKSSYDILTGNSIRLPFFENLPPQLPEYQLMQATEWWTLPLRAAQGAQFLIRAGETDLSAAYHRDILFIMPTPHWIGNCVMLARLGKKYLIRQITMHKQQLTWKKENGAQTAIPPRAKAIGIVVERLTGTIF